MPSRWFRSLLAVVLTGWLSLSTSTAPVAAQSNVTTLSQMNIDLWPDYDQAMVLVIMDGEIPPETTLPATLTLPLPAQADLNAVAQFADDGSLRMITDFTVDSALNNLTMTAPTARFRVEYYIPYTVQGDSRQFDFMWRAAVNVTLMAVSIQQPAAATSLSVTPPATSRTGNDGLTYYDLAPQAVPANTPYQVTLSYRMPSPALTAGNAVTSATPADAGTPATADNGSSSWLLALGVLVLAVAVAVTGWRLSRQRPPARVYRPRPRASVTQTPPTTTPARFCRQCGAPAHSDDRFCGQCGASL